MCGGGWVLFYFLFKAKFLFQHAIPDQNCSLLFVLVIIVYVKQIETVGDAELLRFVVGRLLRWKFLCARTLRFVLVLFVLVLSVVRIIVPFAIASICTLVISRAIIVVPLAVAPMFATMTLSVVLLLLLLWRIVRKPVRFVLIICWICA